ncbi:sulfate ABC transporter substrate-binding protein [Caviibacterium pharyngocola]|uniref:Sulfate ABC transporter substrate-binding protein n=1 Tax=Caviibacterium pharyngocola TaxID=28159 RepID=A0A2M8RZ64_9PAST|nr:sulfate ABC transporter substrate-binding protein [Caviibacterium pharyngocola]PJG84183.1 sulfate ABC transporter substrate-binding protein [Caviibacterium pharyngocola]
MKKALVFSVIFLLLGSIFQLGNSSAAKDKKVLLNVSYDVIRDFYKAYNPLFRAHYKAESGEEVMISQSHGGASKQVLSVANGLPADVVTLTQTNDIDTLAARGLVSPNWREQFPNGAVPFGSVIVFLVKKGNPKGISDWADLVRDDVSVIFANPKTSANGRFAYLAALAYAKRQFGQAEQEQDFMRKLLKNVPILETGARGATISFTQRNLGDVLITPENEAALAAQALGENSFEVVYPHYTAYTPVLVAEVSANTALNRTSQQAKAYLNYLWNDEIQELAAKNHFRPTNQGMLAKYRHYFPEVESFDVNREFGSWQQINTEHFADNGLFDRLYIAAKSGR